MALQAISLLAFCLVIALTLYRYVIVPAILSPLAKIPPIHWSARFSSLWILYYRSREEETPKVHAAHQRLGPIIQLAPNEISVNSIDGGLRTVYAGGFEKGDWYRNVFNNYGREPMFSMREHGKHSKRRKLLSNIYAKSTLQSSQGLSTITRILIKDRLVPRLQQFSKQQDAVDFYYLYTAFTMDFVSAYVVGLKNGSDFIRHANFGKQWFIDYKYRQRFQFWPQELPGLTKFLRRIGMLWLLVPKWLPKISLDIEDWIISMCDKAEADLKSSSNEKVRPEDHPNVYSQLRNALLRESTAKADTSISVESLVEQQRLNVASEMLDHTLAGFDTSSITLTFLAWELSLSRNRHWQEQLHAELSSVSEAETLDAKIVDALPILQAILMESLRLHAAIPGNQPRITPAVTTLGAPGHEVSTIPANVRVQAQGWSLHRNPEVFRDPELWNPGRWLRSSYPSQEAFDIQQTEMKRWFWAFGSGGRMCVGSNLAIYDMKMVTAGIWSRFRTEVVFDEGMAPRGGYVAEPIGKDGKMLLLKVKEIRAG